MISYDESKWARAGREIAHRYALANHELNGGVAVWFARTFHDYYVGGLTFVASLRKHILELEDALHIGHTEIVPEPGDDSEQPPEPLPEPMPKPPVGGGSSLHVGPGPLDEQRARQVIAAAFKEFPALHAVFATSEEAEAAAEQLLRRTIWHLQLAGFQAGRQKNPSGAISKDKLTIKVEEMRDRGMSEDVWRWVDVYTLGHGPLEDEGRPATATTLQIQEFKAEGAQHVPDAGIPD